MALSLINQFIDKQSLLRIDGNIIGIISIDSNSHPLITIEVSGAGKHPKRACYVGTFSGIYIKIVEPQKASKIIWDDDNMTKSTTTLAYKYCLVSKAKNSLSLQSVSDFDLVFPNVFFIDHTIKNNDKIVENESMKIKVNVSSYEHKVLFSVHLKTSVSIEEIISYKIRFERFVTSFLGMSINAEALLFYTDNRSSVVEYIPRDNIEKITSKDIFRFSDGTLRYEERCLEQLLAYVSRFDRVGHAAHWYAAYVEYNRKPVYLESRLFNIMACIDSIANKTKHLQAKTDKVDRRSQMYEVFISEITQKRESGELDSIKSDLYNHLKCGWSKSSFVSKDSFASSLDWVATYAGVAMIDSGTSKSLNQLRNDIAHGKDFDFSDYFNGWVSDSGEIYRPITNVVVENVANIAWEAILKIALDNNKDI